MLRAYRVRIPVRVGAASGRKDEERDLYLRVDVIAENEDGAVERVAVAIRALLAADEESS